MVFKEFLVFKYLFRDFAAANLVYNSILISKSKKTGSSIQTKYFNVYSGVRNLQCNGYFVIEKQVLDGNI